MISSDVNGNEPGGAWGQRSDGSRGVNDNEVPPRRALAISVAVFAGFSALLYGGLAGYGGWIVILIPWSLIELARFTARRRWDKVPAMTAPLLGTLFGYGAGRGVPLLAAAVAALFLVLLAGCWATLWRSQETPL